MVISAGALLKDNQTGKVLAQLKIKNIHDEYIGILAQEMAEYDGYQYILNYDEEAGYSVNSYNLTSAVMSALKEEIRRREELEEKVKQMEQRMSALEELLLQTLQD